MGSLSKKYESGSSGAGTIANNAGDWGGKSYGTYQIATNTGTMNSFLSFLRKNDRGMYNALSRHKTGSSGFDRAWKNLAKNSSFGQVQHAFIKGSHYDPVVKRARNELGINFDRMPMAVRNAIWSLGVQHGTGGAMSVLKNSGVRAGHSAQNMLKLIYNERSKVNKYFSRSSSSIKASVKRRFGNELRDALAML